MGYACPVCGTPQMDAGHLANHLAFTALLGDGDHESWLDEHVPGWADEGEAALAERVVDHAAEEEFPQVFEDTTGDGEQDDPPEERSGALFDEGASSHAGHHHAGEPRDRGSAPDPLAGRRRATASRAPEEEVERILEEARELTEQRRARVDEAADDGSGDDADGNG